jgi:hypothetical protein
MRRALGGVIAVRAEMAAVLGRIAANDVALHACGVEGIDLEDLRPDAAQDPDLRLADHLGVFDAVIRAALAPVVVHLDRLAFDVAHEAGFLAAVLVVQADQITAELRLEHVGQEQDRCLDFDARETFGRRQLLEIVPQGICAAVICRERNDTQHAQRGVQDHPEAAGGDGAFARLRVLGDGAVEAADGPVRVPEEANAGQALAYPSLRLVARIETDAEEAAPLVIELLSVGEDALDRGAPDSVTGRGVKAQNDVASRRGVEGIVRIAGRALVEPRCGIARRQPGVGSRGVGLRAHGFTAVAG